MELQFLSLVLSPPPQDCEQELQALHFVHSGAEVNISAYLFPDFFPGNHAFPDSCTEPFLGFVSEYSFLGEIFTFVLLDGLEKRL